MANSAADLYEQLKAIHRQLDHLGTAKAPRRALYRIMNLKRERMIRLRK